MQLILNWIVPQQNTYDKNASYRKKIRIHSSIFPISFRMLTTLKPHSPQNFKLHRIGCALKNWKLKPIIYWIHYIVSAMMDSHLCACLKSLSHWTNALISLRLFTHTSTAVPHSLSSTPFFPSSFSHWWSPTQHSHTYIHTLLPESCGSSKQPIIRARAVMWLLKLSSSLCELTSAMTHCGEPGSHDAQRTKQILPLSCPSISLIPLLLF